MPSLVFNSTNLNVLNRTLDLTTGTFYGHLVAQVPAQGNTTVANLGLVSGGTYAPQPLVNSATVAIAADGTGARRTFDNPTWAGLTTGNNALTVKGMVAVRQAGASPAATDPIISYIELATTVTTTAAVSPGATSIPIQALAGAGTIPSGTSFTLGGVTVTTTAPATVGATSLAVSAVSGAIPSGSSNPAVPYYYNPNGADLTIQIPTTGILKFG